MRKKPKLSGPLNSAQEHRFFSKSIAKSTEYPPFLASSIPQDSRPLLPFAIYSVPYPSPTTSPYSYPRCVITPVAAHFWNCDITNSFSRHISPPTLTIIITHIHHTLHRISGIAQRGARNRLKPKDPNPTLSRCSAQFLHWISHVYASTPPSWAFHRLP